MILHNRLNVPKNDQRIYPSGQSLHPFLVNLTVISRFPGRPLKVDFLLKNEHWNTYVAVECKLQNSPGSADQKLYFMGESLLKTCPYPSLIILMGNGFAKPTINYLNSLVGEKVKAILKFEDNHAWLDYILVNDEHALDEIGKLKTSTNEQLEFQFHEVGPNGDEQLQLAVNKTHTNRTINAFGCLND